MILRSGSLSRSYLLLDGRAQLLERAEAVVGRALRVVVEEREQSWGSGHLFYDLLLPPPAQAPRHPRPAPR